MCERAEPAPSAPDDCLAQPIGVGLSSRRLLAVMTLPRVRGTRINSTNVQQRLNRELKRRTDEAQVSPMDDAALRLSDAILFAVSDEEAVDERRFLSQASLPKLCDPAAATGGKVIRVGSRTGSSARTHALIVSIAH